MKTIFAVAALLALSGCLATTNPDSPGTEGELFDDLPAAPGLKLDKPGYGHKSKSGTLREYKYEYSGSRRIEDTRKFYEDAFPVHGWTLVKSEGADPATLTFEKRAEKVTVALRTAGNVLKVVVHVTGK